VCLAVAALVGGCGGSDRAPQASARQTSAASSADSRAGGPGAPSGIHKIRHVVVIMQENRSFDTYFGTFPGADGIPMRNGVPSVCVPDAAGHACARPFHDRANVSAGGPHGATAAAADVDGGRMDGFIHEQRRGRRVSCPNVNSPPPLLAVRT